jgi:hypothetical protein
MNQLKKRHLLDSKVNTVYREGRSGHGLTSICLFAEKASDGIAINTGNIIFVGDNTAYLPPYCGHVVLINFCWISIIY